MACRMALVLCTGVDPVLLQTRKLILEQAGHKVVTATDQCQITTACAEHRFDVVVIGQTVSANLKSIIASLIRNHCPSAKILELYPPHQGRAVEHADLWLEVPAAVPKHLADRVNELAGKTKPPGTPA